MSLEVSFKLKAVMISMLTVAECHRVHIDSLIADTFKSRTSSSSHGFHKNDIAENPRPELFVKAVEKARKDKAKQTSLLHMKQTSEKEKIEYTPLTMTMAGTSALIPTVGGSPRAHGRPAMGSLAREQPASPIIDNQGMGHVPRTWRSAANLWNVTHGARSPDPKMVQEEEEFVFGDAADVTVGSVVEDEGPELTEKQKEIARLRAAEKFMMKDTGNANCSTCGYKYKWDEGVPAVVPKKTPFELVPDTFACPNCKSPKAFFKPEQVEIAGFAENQAYGLGTNTWTESQKNLAIFGGLGSFFALFLAGYGLN